MITTTQLGKAFLLIIPMFFVSGAFKNEAQKPPQKPIYVPVLTKTEQRVKNKQDTAKMMMTEISNRFAKIEAKKKQ